MINDFQKFIENSNVSAARVSSCDYEKLEKDGEILNAIRRNAENLGWADGVRGAFGKIVGKGSKVILKPNFVLHRNQGTDGMLPLVTHPAAIKAVTEEVLKADPAQVLIGDAPLQSCDFQELLKVTKIGDWAEEFKKKDERFKGIKDFRRTICVYRNGVRVADEELQPAENYVLYNFGKESLLEPLTDGKNRFRITNYDPRFLAKTHSPGNHQYLVARDIIEADTVINLPKLKTHKKAGITNALKNLVGINGNKEYLPHHRLGGTINGGDCYPDGSVVKRSWEYISDRQNMTKSAAKEKMLATINTQFERMMRLQGDEIGVEGAWSGNETVARMCIDLNRILLYGKPDSTFGKTVQRKVLHVCDAVIAGQGDGPLASDALEMNLILAANNAAALDWFGAFLLGYDAEKIPLLNFAFSDFHPPIAAFSPDEIKLFGEFANFSTNDFLEFAKAQKVTHPAGWRDAAPR